MGGSLSYIPRASIIRDAANHRPSLTDANAMYGIISMYVVQVQSMDTSIIRSYIHQLDIE